MKDLKAISLMLLILAAGGAFWFIVYSLMGTIGVAIFLTLTMSGIIFLGISK
jgi:hypothetical protein